MSETKTKLNKNISFQKNKTKTKNQKETLKKDISYDNIKKKKNEVKKPKLIITEKKYPKTPVLKTKRRGRKIIHEAKKTNITNLLKNKNIENTKKNNLTPEKTLKKHINQTTNVSYCLNYNKNALNKTPEEKKRGIKIFPNNKLNYDNIALNNEEKNNIVKQRKIFKDFNSSSYNDLFQRDFKNNINGNKTQKLIYNVQKDHMKEIFDYGFNNNNYIGNKDNTIPINPTKENYQQLIDQISINNKDKLLYKQYQ